MSDAISAAAMGPHSVEAEQMVLGSVLVDATAWDRIGELRGDDFMSSDHAAIFEAARDCWLAGDAAEIVMVVQRLRDAGNLDRVGGMSYVSALANAVPGTMSVGRYAQIVSDRAKLRGLMGVGAQISDMARDPALNPADAIEQALGMVGALADGKSMTGVESFADVVDDATVRAITGNRVLYKNMLGLHALEEKFGALEPGQLIVMAGRPAMGKTTVGLQCGLLAAAAGYHTLIQELEMTGVSLANRALAAWSNIPLKTIRYGSNAAIADKLRGAAERLKRLPMQLNTTPGMHVDGLRAQCRAMARRKPLQLIVVDHLTLMRGEGRDKREQVGYVSNTLKVIAKENNAVVLALVQLNRQAEGRMNKRPELSDLRESGEIEQDADGVIMLYRDDYYHPESPAKGVIELIIRKNRDGETGTAYGKAELHVCRVDDLPRDYVPQTYERKGSAFAGGNDAGF